MKKQIENEVLTSKENAKGVESQQIVNTKGEGSMLNNRQKTMENFRKCINYSKLEGLFNSVLLNCCDEVSTAISQFDIDILAVNLGKGREVARLEFPIGEKKIYYTLELLDIQEESIGFRCKCYGEVLDEISNGIETYFNEGLLAWYPYYQFENLCFLDFNLSDWHFKVKNDNFAFYGEFCGEIGMYE